MSGRAFVRSSRVAAAALTAALLSLGAYAAPCRSEAAATAGSVRGYTTDTQAADATEQQDRSASDILGRCVGGVTGVITIPTFPSLDEIFNQIKNEICRIASEQVHQAVGNVGLAINAAMRNVPTYGGPSAIATPGVSVHSTSTMPAAITPPASSTTTGGSDFWSSIWR